MKVVQIPNSFPPIKKSICRIAQGSEKIDYLMDPYLKNQSHRRTYFVVGETHCKSDYYCYFNKPGHACMMYFASGQGTLRVNEKTQRITGGTIILMREGEEWEYSTDPRDPWTLYWINISSSFMLAGFQTYPTGPLCISQNEAILPDFWKLYEDIKNKEISFTEKRNRALRHCLLLMQNFYALVVEKQKKTSIARDAEAMMDYINAHITENMNVHQIAKLVFRSDGNAGKIFKQIYGFSIKDYILYAKCDFAARLLRETDCSISEITQMLSFCSSQHFSQIFRQQLGVSPSVYRKEYLLSL